MYHVEGVLDKVNNRGRKVINGGMESSENSFVHHTRFNTTENGVYCEKFQYYKYRFNNYVFVSFETNV